MKTFIKVFTIAATFLLTFGSADAQRYAAASTTPASVVQLYKNLKQSGQCVGVSFVTNQVSKNAVSLEAPTSTWGSSGMGVHLGGLKSSKAKRYWSSRLNGNQPFASNKTDYVEVVLRKQGNNVIAKLIKNGSTTFNINVLGVVAKGNGHMLYGTYGNHGGFITISLYKMYCPEG